MKNLFYTFIFLFVVIGRSADGFVLWKILDSLWEDSESPTVNRHQPAMKSGTSSSQNKPSHEDNVQQQQQQHHHENDVDYAGNIFKKLLSGKVIDELVDILADCIDDSGLFDFLDPSEEEIDSDANGTQGTVKPEDKESTTKAVSTTNPATTTPTPIVQTTTTSSTTTVKSTTKKG